MPLQLQRQSIGIQIFFFVVDKLGVFPKVLLPECREKTAIIPESTDYKIFRFNSNFNAGKRGQGNLDAMKRLWKEHIDLCKDPLANCSVSLIDENNVFHWLGTIMGAEDSPFAGGVFFLDF